MYRGLQSPAGNIHWMYMLEKTTQMFLCTGGEPLLALPRTESVADSQAYCSYQSFLRLLTSSHNKLYSASCRICFMLRQVLATCTSNRLASSNCKWVIQVVAASMQQAAPGLLPGTNRAALRVQLACFSKGSLLGFHCRPCLYRRRQ